MKNKEFHLTFSTKPEVSFFLSKIAHASGMTQPELINAICIEFIKRTLSDAEANGFMSKTQIEEVFTILESKENSATTPKS